MRPPPQVCSPLTQRVPLLPILIQSSHLAQFDPSRHSGCTRPGAVAAKGGLPDVNIDVHSIPTEIPFCLIANKPTCDAAWSYLIVSVTVNFA